jgi:hypothetical protein
MNMTKVTDILAKRTKLIDGYTYELFRDFKGVAFVDDKRENALKRVKEYNKDHQNQIFKVVPFKSTNSKGHYKIMFAFYFRRK